MNTKLQIFNDQKVRSAWDKENEEWYFSVVDVVAVLTDSDYQAARKYWKVLKGRLTDEGSELVTNCYQLKMRSPGDGKNYATDVLDTKGVLRLVQSIPSPKAEPFKIWLAKVGSERLDEIADPEKAILRGADYYRAKGYSEDWTNRRLQTIRMRKELTDEWKASGVQEGVEYAILTNEMTVAWSGMTTAEYKEYKGLHKESLRDNMTDIELALNMLAEVTTTAISRQEKPDGFEESRKIAKRGGGVARTARESVEKELGETVVSPLNAEDKQQLDTKATKRISTKK